MQKLIIQVAINEYVTREQNPLVPMSIQEIAQDATDCANAGASIVHFHPRDPKTGLTRPADVAMYAEIAQRFRAKCDLIYYPTYGSEKRLGDQLTHVYELTTHPIGKLEAHLIGLAPVNLAGYDASKRRFLYDEPYASSFSEFIPFFEFCNKTGLKPFLIAYELGHIRAALRYREMGLLRDPLVLHLRFSDAHSFGPLPNADGIRSYLSVVPKGVPVQWFTQVYGAPHYPMNRLAIQMGGHARIGIGELAREPKSPRSNARIVESIVKQARRDGREIASTAEARKLLGMKTPS
ncbi:MAG: 3-keto-5-aminohexanoate cleavage protein [Chloroflexi bacterium]|nr:3-keto-5-aminohexanoate cleavage protein [Chloroflexota bacterium]